MIDLDRTRAAMDGLGIDAWALYDFRGSNPVLWQVLGVEPPGTSRRVWLVLGRGEPRLLVSPLDRNLVAGIGVEPTFYGSWAQLSGALESALDGAGRVAMEYSPLNALPAVGWADAGAVELVRTLADEVVSSAELFQAVAAALDAAALASHHDAVEQVVGLHEDVRAWAREGLGTITERELATRTMAAIAARGLETDHPPAVGVGPGSGDPHREAGDVVIGRDALLLVDIWARRPGDRNVFGDITWMSWTGAGAPPDAVQSAFDAVRAGRDAALALLRDGWAAGTAVRGCDADRAARTAIEAAGHGAGLLHRTGHSLSPGPTVHGLGANLDDLETHDDRVLAPGTAFTVEPGVYGPDFGVRLECDVYVDPQTGPVVTTPLQEALTRLG